jgi:hypothetical protein
MVADASVSGHARMGRAAFAVPREGGERASWQRVVVDGLEAHGYVTSRRGAGHVEFRCPAHEDRKPSGTADYDAASGQTLICCHQGCSAEDVLAAVGCVLADLYDYPREREERPARPLSVIRTRPSAARPPKTGPEEPKCEHDWQLESEHPYPDENGELRNTVIRKRCSLCRVKDTRPARPWPEADRILYRLPEVLEAVRGGATVWVHEGEMCADAGAQAGQVSTTNPFGAGKWLDRYTGTLLGARRVVIVADNDAAGYRHAADVAARLAAAGIPHEVMRVPGGAPKADIVDHLASGGTPQTLIPADPAAMLAQLEAEAREVLTAYLAALRSAGRVAVTAREAVRAVLARVGADRTWIPAMLREAADRGELAPGEDADTYELRAARPPLGLAATVQVPDGQRIPVDPLALPASISLLDARRYDPGDWPHIVPGLLPVGLVLIYGRPGVAKTTMSAQLEHCIAAGTPVAGYQPDAPGRCLVIDFEGGPMLAIGQSLRIVPFGELATDVTGDPDEMISVRTAWPGGDFAERAAELEKVLREASHAGRPYRLVRIDTMRAFMGPPPLGMNAYQWDADCLIRINALARELHTAIVVIHHPNKSGEVSGSVGIEGSCTASYRLERKAGESEGLLRCTKNRVGPEQSYAVEFDTRAGTWTFSDQISAAQAANTGVKRQIIDYLTEHGPAAGPDIRAALPNVRDRTVRDMLTRLRHDGWVDRSHDGAWMLAGPSATATEPPPPARPAQAAVADGQPADQRGPRKRYPVGTCAACGTPMTILWPGQTRHPLCDPASEPAAPQPPPTPATAPAPEAEPDSPAGDTCAVCGEPRTDADTHPDCDDHLASEAKWPAVAAMREAFTTSRMKPIPWIPPPGHPAVKQGMHTRDMPPWRAAEETDTGAFKWIRPRLLEEFGPDRLVLTIDRIASFPSACSSVPVAPNVLRPVQLEGDPKAEGLAGIARVIVPDWTRTDLPHPLGRHAVPGQPLVIPSGTLEELWALHRQGLITEPQVIEAFMGRRNTSLFEPFYKAVKAARDEHAGDAIMTVAVKRSSSKAVRLLYPQRVKSPWWRADWYGAIVGQAMMRHWIRGRQAVDAGHVLCGMGSVDAASYLVPDGADPDTWAPKPPYKIDLSGREFGAVRPKHITVRADRVDLTGIDPARITPSRHRDGYLEISGPVPLRIWMEKTGG